MQYAVLKCILEQKYDRLINVTIYDQFIAPYLLRRYSKYAIVALKLDLVPYSLIKNCYWPLSQEKTIGLEGRMYKSKTKKTIKKKKLIKMQQPTAEAIKEQVSGQIHRQFEFYH